MADKASDELKADKALLAVEKLRIDAARISDKFGRDSAQRTIADSKRQATAIKDQWQAGEISFKHYDELVNKNTRLQQKIHREALAGNLDAWTGMKAKTGSMMEQLGQKMGLDIEKAGALGIALWVIGLIDAQRVMVNWSTNTVKLFGKAGRDGAEAWNNGFIAPGAEMLANARFVSDSMRLAFSQAAQHIGLAINGVSGEKYQNTMERLIVVGSAFGISAEDMAGKLFNVQDIFQTTTAEAGASIEHMVQLSKKMGVAPQRFVGMVSELTNQFKLQNLSLKDVEQGFYGYQRSAHLGVQATEELTRSTFRALQTLSMSKVAGLLTLANGGGPAANLGDQIYEFYKGEGKYGKSRFEMLQNAFTSMTKMIPDKFSGMKLAMSLSGVTDPETGARLYDLLSHTQEIAAAGGDAAKEARDIMGGQTSAQEQAMNFITNALNMIIRYLMSIAMASGKTDTGTKAHAEAWSNLREAQEEAKQKRSELRAGPDFANNLAFVQELDKKAEASQKLLDYVDTHTSAVAKEIEDAQRKELKSGKYELIGSLGGHTQHTAQEMVITVVASQHVKELLEINAELKVMKAKTNKKS